MVVAMAYNIHVARVKISIAMRHYHRPLMPQLWRREQHTMSQPIGPWIHAQVCITKHIESIPLND